jgi:hypothetical protein
VTCKTCKHYDLDAVKNKAGRIQPGWAGRCLWQFDYPMPLSITRSRWPAPRAGYMEPGEGEGCPTWGARDE